MTSHSDGLALVAAARQVVKEREAEAQGEEQVAKLRITHADVSREVGTLADLRTDIKWEEEGARVKAIVERVREFFRQCSECLKKGKVGPSGVVTLTERKRKEVVNLRTLAAKGFKDAVCDRLRCCCGHFLEQVVIALQTGGPGDEEEPREGTVFDLGGLISLVFQFVFLMSFRLLRWLY